MIKNGITYNKFYLNGVEYNKGFRNNVQIFGANTPSILDGAELYLPLDSPDSRVNTYNNPLFVSGKKDNALSFNGSNQYASVSSIDTDIKSNSVSFGGWIKVNSVVSGNDGFIGKNIAAGVVGRYGICLAGENSFSIVYQTVDNVIILSNPTLISNYLTIWTHVVGVIDKSNSLLKLYINGNLVNSTYANPSTVSITNSVFLLSTYGDSTGNSPLFNANCFLDEVFFMRKALTSSQVLQLYNEYS